jgi:Cd2+/Zn2+-exporting ATPase
MLLVIAGKASLWIAIAADMGASLLVIFNALRLLGTGTDLPDEMAQETGSN